MFPPSAGAFLYKQGEAVMLKLFAIAGVVSVFGLIANKCTINRAADVVPFFLGF